MRRVSYYIKENGAFVKIDLNEEVAAAAYKQYVSQNIREFNLRVKFDNKELSASDISSIRINSDLFNTDTFTIGSVVAETLELTIFTDTVYGHSDVYLDKSRPIIPFISLKTIVEIETAEGFIPTEVWQETSLGVFYINPDGIHEDGFGVMSVRASAMFNHPDYSNKSLDISAKEDKNLERVIEFVKDVDDNNNPNFTLLNEDLPDINVKIENINDKTVREVVAYVATLYGGYARTFYNVETDKVYLEFFRKQQVDYVYDESNYVSFTRGGAGTGLNITRIDCKIDDKITMKSGSGTLANNTVIIECADMSQERLDAILTEFKNYNYRPTTTKIFGNPLLEPGDVATIKGRGVNSQGDELPLHTVVYNITGSGITMDIKSLFKINQPTKKKTEQDSEDEKSELEKLKEDVSKDIAELYDRTTMEEGEDPLTIKEDYIATKEIIEGLSNKQTTLETTLNNHINSSSSTPGTLTNPIEFKSTISGSETLIGMVGSGKTGATSHNPQYEVFLTSTDGYLLTLGSGKSSATQTSYNRDLIICSESFGLGGVNYGKGLNMTDPIILGTMRFKSWITMDDNSDGEPIGYGEMYAMSDKSFWISGQNHLTLGLHKGGEYENGLILTHATDSETGTETLMIRSFADINMTNRTIYNVTLNGATILNGLLSSNLNANYKTIYRAHFDNCTGLENITKSTTSQSEYTSSLIENGTNENIMHSNMSYDSDELRWCWKETVFTYPECDIDPDTDEWIYTGRNICYIELPIFMAENIQNDYHINISKMSWGDYRIIEKNPYYFILESQEEDFAFTFEVVAKLNDNQTLNGNAIVANDGYEVFGYREVNED